MSQLRSSGSADFGKHQFPTISWDDFVDLVVQTTIEAYKQMRQGYSVQREWEENTFTECLVDDYLQKIAFDNSMMLSTRGKIHTEAMKKGQQATIEAKEFDLALFGMWEPDHRRKNFVWEAKRIGGRKEHGNLIPEYIHEAIYRFIHLEYADGLPNAGVLGYVLSDEVARIVEEINLTMSRISKNPPLPVSEHLHKISPIQQFEDVYASEHKRVDQSNIYLHHLFLTFDFA